jgi:ABC-2 type transport system ATP-binding protein
MTPIAFKHLTKAVGGTTVLHDLTWTVPPGAFCGLLGRNGAGKTVLLQTAMGLLLPDAGDALVLGHPLAVGCPEAKREVGYVPQDTWLPPWARVKDVMGVERAARRHWDGQAVERWLRQEGIPSRRPLKALSGGQRKRLELQLVLAARPRVLLMDEPFAALDPVSKAAFTSELLGYIAACETTLVLSSHALPDLERFCDRIAILAQGRIALELTMDELKSRDGLAILDGPSHLEHPPIHAEVLASRTCGPVRSWLVRRLDGQGSAAHLSVRKPSLEETGVALLEYLDPKGETHVSSQLPP